MPLSDRDALRGTRRDPIVVIGVAALAVALLATLWVAAPALLIVFGGTLLAQLLRGLAVQLSRRTGLGVGWTFPIVVAALAGGLVGLGFAFAPVVAEQIFELRQAMPTSVDDARRMVERNAVGRLVVDVLEQAGGENALSLLSNVPLGAPLTLVAYPLGILFVGLFVGATPGVYRDGLVALVPPDHRERAREVAGRLGSTLRWWILGQTVAMTFVGTFVTAALWLIGVPLALLLGIVVGLLTFMPYIGPFIGAWPVLLVTLLLAPDKLLIVLVAYGTIQGLEGYLLTPLVQRRAVSLPPAVTVAAQFVMGLLVGPLGVAFATPLAAVLLVLVREVYVRDLLGDPDRRPGDRGPAAPPGSRFR